MAENSDWASWEDWQRFLEAGANDWKDPEAEKPKAEAPSFQTYSRSQGFVTLIVPVETHYYMPDGDDVITTVIQQACLN